MAHRYLVCHIGTWDDLRSLVVNGRHLIGIR